MKDEGRRVKDEGGAAVAAGLIDLLDVGTALSDAVEAYVVDAWCDRAGDPADLVNRVTAWRNSARAMLTLITAETALPSGDHHV